MTKLEKFLTEHAEDIAYLTTDQDGESTGHHATPGSRYGWNSAQCAPVAVVLAHIVAATQGEETTEDDLDFAMGLVVNDHADVEYMIRNYADEVGISARTLIRDLL
jgi:hypothetical protein